MTKCESSACSPDIIWTMVSGCRLQCSGCCTAAKPLNRKYAKKGGAAGEISVGSDGLKSYKQAHIGIIESGHELSLENKKKVVTNLPKTVKRLELSGGDISTSPHALDIFKSVEEAKKVDRVTTTVVDSDRNPIRIPKSLFHQLKRMDSRVSFAVDASIISSSNKDSTRPVGYGSGNINFCDWLSSKNYRNIRAELTLHRGLLKNHGIERILDGCAENEIPNVLVMRPFNVGYARRKYMSDYDLSNVETFLLVDRILKWGAKTSKTAVTLQCSLRGLNEENACDAGSGSWGITPLGNLIPSPWLYTQKQKVLIPELDFGSLVEFSWNELMDKESVYKFVDKLSMPSRYCRVQAALSSENSLLDGFIYGVDPLYR